ncbi:MAG TPA: ElyC/SanA/YdcF family protein [Bacteroidia bacterium]|nr:ElyC/SanA/YdcF family protein [Bacteroidia bacterium]
MPRKRWRSITFWTVALSAATVVALVAACNLWIVLSTRDRVHDSAATVEAREYGVVLGTSKKSGPDTPNQHFENRMAAAAALYHEGKVRRLLVSGYRDSRYYDETRDMLAKLKELGVPADALLADDRGVRTLDSIVRAKTVFGVDRAVIVSDDFHVNRALFIADHEKLDAIALRSESVDYDDSRKVRMREYLARVKAVIDLYLWAPGMGPAPAALTEG